MPSSPPSSIFSFQVCREQHQQPGPRRAGTPQETPRLSTARRAATRLPADAPPAGTSPPHSAGPKRLSAHLARTQRAHAPRQARSSRWLAGERVRPGVTAALPLTLAAASHWPAGPSSGHACWRAQVRPRARQAHIRECLGQQQSVLTQVPN